MKKRVRVKVNGRVQGVFFRANTEKQAKRLGLRGWVKNTDDSVEVLVEGDDKKIQELIDWCHKGPMFAKVESVDVKEEKFTDEFDAFVIER